MMFVRYVFIQLIAYAIDLGVFVLIVSSGLSEPLVANISSKIAAGAFAFICHRNFTFDAKYRGSSGSQAIRYAVVLGLNIPLTTALLALAMLWIEHVTLAKVCADAAGVVITFWISRVFVFAGPGRSLRGSETGQQPERQIDRQTDV